MISWYRLFAVLRKEFWQLKRDRLTIGMIVGIPVIQILMFGFAINTDVRHLPMAVVNQENSQLSRELIADIQASQVALIKYRVKQVSEIETLLREGKVSIGLVIPHDFERRLQDEKRPAAQLLVDGSDPLILASAHQLTAMRLHHKTQETAQSNKLFEVRNYYNPERRSVINTVPGLIGVILTMTMMIFTAVSIVRERERGNLELLINTPITRTELMVGKVVPYIVIGFIQVTLVVVLGAVIFKVPIHGSIADVYIVSLLFVLANLALGLLFSTIAKSQFQALQMAIFVMLPSILLSGFAFPFDGMPKLAQWFAEILPMTHFVRLIRGIMLKGANITELYQELAILMVFTVLVLVLAIKRFHKRLD
ncbi:transport permease protein [Thiomicrorhabdus immobilis]|uniref:Transport permease protein n=1 Tax=Thiomicrorhabdus immobilis TaxID=2791037 RepID=A0ABN6CUR5_9GAMM|nr:ABC transporter permease [Thiomicrorhabdus immobilis]BCN92726.1 transport permease protein [Thiomicrorhabdus immobilis]